MIPHNGTINMYRHGTHVGGALRLRRLQWFLERAASSKEVRGRPWAAKALREMAITPNFMKWTSRTPWRRGETPLKLAPTYEDWAIRVCFEHTDYDRCVCTQPRLEVPTEPVSGIPVRELLTLLQPASPL